MNTTAAVRQYIKDHPNQIVDVAHLHRTLFPIVDKRTFLKILSRLDDEGLIKLIGRGVYAPAALSEEKTRDAVLDYYVGHTSGTLFGEALFFKLGLIDKAPKMPRIYTNRLSNGSKKHVLEYELIGADVVFDDSAVDLVTLLELLENHNKLISSDGGRKYTDAVKKFCQSYSEMLVQEVTEAIHYRESTMATFRTLT